MIRPVQDSLANLASAWVSGIAALFLAIGTTGSLTPISPTLTLGSGDQPPGDRVLLEQEFAPPPSDPQTAEEPIPAQAPAVAEVEIPALPDITPPLQPPEMLELRPVEPVVERTKPAPTTPPPETPRPEPPPPPPQPQPSSKPARTSSTPRSTGTPSNNNTPVLFSGGGGGRFPAPGYPSSARSARLEGTVKLLVTVEASGVPTSVSIDSSSGHTLLDTAARDHIRRNWRWPSGETRLFIVPIKFVLK
jgi:protein TonB